MYAEKGLGERPAYDGRDSRYLMAVPLTYLTAGRALPEEKVWRHGRISDQGSEGACVGHAWTGWINCEPVRPRLLSMSVIYNDRYASGVYERAKRLDEWPGTDYVGTSTRAGAKVMKERFYLDAYLHATSYEEVRAWLLVEGPVVLSCRWDEASYYPDRQGFLRHGGRVVGGHAFLCYGVLRDGTLVCANSWGEDFGKEGSFYVAKEEWLYRMRMGYWAAISARQLPWRERRRRRHAARSG